MLQAKHRKLQILKISDRSREIGRMAVGGASPAKIALALGVTPQTVQNHLNSEIIREHIDELHDEADGDAIEVSKRIRELAPKALDILSDAIQDGFIPLGKPDPKTGERALQPVASMIRLGVAKDVLDRAGFSPVRKQINATTTLNASDVEIIKKRREAVNRAKENGILDVEVQDAAS